MANILKKAARKVAIANTKAISNQPVPYVGRFQSGKPIWSDWSTENAIKNGLKANVWVYACQRKLASAVSSIPWYVEGTEDGEKWERIPGHPIEILLSEANPFMSGQDLMERLIYHLYLGGNGIWKMIIVRGFPVELWPLMPDKVTPIPDHKAFISRYEYRVHGNSKPLAFDPREIIHFQFVDPSNPYWGLAPIKAAAMTIDTDVEAIKWNKVSLQNRAVKDGFIFPQNQLTLEQWRESRRALREELQGSDNARGIFLGMGPATVQGLSMSPAEMDFLNSRKFTVAEIAVVHGVPVVLLSPERSTFNNMLVARKIFWEDTVIPLLDDLAEALNMALVPYWDPESVKSGVPPKLRIVYDISNVTALQQNMDQKISAAEKLFNMGVPFNEINQRLELGFADIPGGDLPRGGQSLQELIQAADFPDHVKKQLLDAHVVRVNVKKKT